MTIDLEKYKKLKKLGFKYITRNMNGRLFAWKNKPNRSMVVLKGYKKQFKKQFKCTEIYEVYENLGNDFKCQNGCFIEFCEFIHQDSDKEDYTCIRLDEKDKDFEEIAWDNSPYKI